MNFITRNFGWILLILFFVFMFILVTLGDPNKNSENKNATGSEMAKTQTGVVGDDEIDALMSIVEDSELTDDDAGIKDKDSKKDIIKKEDKKSIIEKIFGKDDSSSDENPSASESSEETEGEEVDPVSESNTAAEKQPKASGLTSAQEYYKSLYLTEPETFDYPGTQLETAVNNYYEVGVHSLKLNNKYFNTTLGYLMRGDVLRQLSPENSYGCFAVEVIESKNSSVQGTQGYVCKKWLQASNYSQDAIVDNQIPVTSEIGSVYLINEDVQVDNTELLQNDVIDQLSSSYDGCADFLVRLASKIESQGKVLTLCDTASFTQIK